MNEKIYEVTFSPTFLKKLKKYNKDIQTEIAERVELLKHIENHIMLRVHKLKGRLKDSYSFSVGYQHRIVFDYLDQNTIYLLNFGGHEIYDK